MSEDYKKPTAALGIYLGKEPERSERREKLKAVAERLTAQLGPHISVSEMLQMIADGKLEVVVPSQDKRRA